MLPAPGQGALGLECRADDTTTQQLVAQLDDPASRVTTAAERSLLAKLHGGCSAPVGAWGRLRGKRLLLDALVASLDGTQVLRTAVEGSQDDAEALGQRAAQQLLEQGAAEIIAAARSA